MCPTATAGQRLAVPLTSQIDGDYSSHVNWSRSSSFVLSAKLMEQRQCLGAAARRQETIETDPDEAFRKDVEAEASEKFLRADGHQADEAPVSVVLPSKGHVAFGHGPR